MQGRKNQKGRVKYDLSFKMKVAREYLEGNLSLPQLGQKYGVNFRRIFEWKEQYSPELSEEIIIRPMTLEEQKSLEALQKQNQELLKQLEHAQMKAKAYEILIELAEEQYGIEVRKNSGARHPKDSDNITPQQA